MPHERANVSRSNLHSSRRSLAPCVWTGCCGILGCVACRMTPASQSTLHACALAMWFRRALAHGEYRCSSFCVSSIRYDPTEHGDHATPTGHGTARSDRLPPMARSSAAAGISFKGLRNGRKCRRLWKNSHDLFRGPRSRDDVYGVRVWRRAWLLIAYRTKTGCRTRRARLAGRIKPLPHPAAPLLGSANSARARHLCMRRFKPEVKRMRSFKPEVQRVTGRSRTGMRSPQPFITVPNGPKRFSTPHSGPQCLIQA